MPGTSSSSSCDTPCCSGVGNRVTCHKGRMAIHLPEPGLSRPHPLMGKRAWDPLTSLNGGSALCRDRKTHAVGKDLRYHLVAQRGQCLGLRPTASQQPRQLCVPVLHLPAISLQSTRLASSWLCQIWQGDTRGRLGVLPSASFSPGPGLHEGRACLVPKAQHLTMLFPTNQRSCCSGPRTVPCVWAPGTQWHHTKPFPLPPSCCLQSRG